MCLGSCVACPPPPAPRAPAPASLTCPTTTLAPHLERPWFIGRHLTVFPAHLYIGAGGIAGCSLICALLVPPPVLCFFCAVPLYFIP